MIYQVMNIKAETYEEPAKLYLYLLEKSPEIGIDKRPLIFICPGGGYGMTSDRGATDGNRSAVCGSRFSCGSSPLQCGSGPLSDRPSSGGSRLQILKRACGGVPH